MVTPIVLTETAGHAVIERAAPGRIARGAPLLVLAPAASGAEPRPLCRPRK
jgi:phosphocarrier protein FPr/phosphocarrier protein